MVHGLVRAAAVSLFSTFRERSLGQKLTRERESLTLSSVWLWLPWEHPLPLDVVSYRRETFLASLGPVKSEILLQDTWILSQSQSHSLKPISVTGTILCSLKYFGLLESDSCPACAHGGGHAAAAAALQGLSKSLVQGVRDIWSYGQSKWVWESPFNAPKWHLSHKEIPVVTFCYNRESNVLP